MKRSATGLTLRTIVVAAVCLAPCHVLLQAQFVERVEVSVANVDVFVTDAEGNPVRGLTKDDFEIFEEGKLQAITNFTAIDIAPASRTSTTDAGPGVPADAATSSAQPRLIVLFVDIADIEPSRRTKFFDGVRDFFSTALRKGDVASVLTWNHRVRVLLEPTSDVRAVNLVLESLGTPFGAGEDGLAAKLAEFRTDQIGRDSDPGQSVGLEPLSDTKSELAFQEWQRGEERCAAIRRKANEIRTIIASLGRVDMQKLIIFASDDASLSPGCSTRPEFDRLGDTANAYGITIYAVHPPGNRDHLPFSDKGGYLPQWGASASLAEGYSRTFDEAGGLLAIARRTGGLTAIGPQQSTKLLVRAVRELDVHYSLGYRVTTPADDKPRSIVVTTKNRNQSVRVRESIVHLSETSRIRDLVTTSLYLPEDRDAKGPAFTVRVGEGTRDGRYLVVPVELRFDARDLELLPSSEGRSTATVSFFVTSGRELGDASDVTEIRKDFEIPTPTDDAPSNVLYSFAVRVRPDTLRLSVALRDNVSGDVGARVVGLGGGGPH